MLRFDFPLCSSPRKSSALPFTLNKTSNSMGDDKVYSKALVNIFPTYYLITIHPTQMSEREARLVS